MGAIYAFPISMQKEITTVSRLLSAKQFPVVAVQLAFHHC